MRGVLPVRVRLKVHTKANVKVDVNLHVLSVWKTCEIIKVSFNKKTLVGMGHVRPSLCLSYKIIFNLWVNFEPIKTFFLDQLFIKCWSTKQETSLLILFWPDSGIGIGHPDGQLLGPFDECLAVLGGDSMGDLSAELLVCIVRTSNSLMLCMRTFLKPIGSMCLVLLFEP